MKRIFTQFLTMVLAVLAIGTANADQITYGNGTKRNYTKYLPADLGENRPLLISMHGMNQDPGYQAGMLQIESVADTAKFLTIFPEGIDRGWDIGGQRDIEFVLALIDEMVRLYHIDRNRVYLSGFSMGGMFTYHAMNYIADKIAAFAPISGYPMGGQPFTSSRPVPIIHTHGTTDDVVTYDRVQSSLDGWIERNGCSKTPIVTTGYRYSGCDRYQWGPGDDGVEVVHIKRYDKGHWIANDVFKTGEEIWNFCKRYSLNSNQPTVKLNSPTDNTKYYGIGKTLAFDIDIDADVTSEVSEIQKVNIYGDNELVGTIDQAPWKFTWSGVNKGQHFIKVEAVDARGVACARGFVLSTQTFRSVMSLHDYFNADGIVPDGWVLRNGRAIRTGYTDGLTAGPRVIEFTGEPREFNFGIYTSNINGKADAGTMTFADETSNARLLLSPGTYQVTYKVCNYNCPSGAPVRVKVVDAVTGQVMAQDEVMPNVNIGNSTSASFSGVEEHQLNFATGEDNMYIKILFFTDDEKNSDLVVGRVSIRQKSTEGITDICAPESTATAVRYFDLTGRELQNPQGLVIRATSFSDGTVSNEKVIVK